MHYYSFNIGDYIKDTSHLSLIEDLAYRRLLDLYYTTESPLDNDIKQIARKIRMNDNHDEIKIVLEEFFYLNGDGLWENSRCKKDLHSIYNKSEKARESAKARWDKGKNKQNECERNANAMRTDSDVNANGMLHNTQYTLPNTQDTKHSTQDTVYTHEQESAREAKPKPSKTRTPKPIDLLLDAGVDEQTAKDFLQVRAAKKSPLTATALKGIANEAEKAGLTTAQAVEISTKNGWASFRASWDWHEKAASMPQVNEHGRQLNSRELLEQENAQIAREFLIKRGFI